ncbi:MAG: hypothetical protein ABFC96_11295 [Thermoguttaceae bacterium]
MIAKKLAAIVLALAVVAVAQGTSAQSGDDEPRTDPKPSFIDRVDLFGKRVFNTILPPSKSKKKTSGQSGGDAASRRAPDYDAQAQDDGNASRAGSVLGRNTRRSPGVSTPDPLELPSDDATPAKSPQNWDQKSPQTWDQARKPVRRVPVQTAPREMTAEESTLPTISPAPPTNSPTPPTTAPATGPMTARETIPPTMAQEASTPPVPALPDASADTRAATVAQPEAGMSRPAARPLSERMAGFRQSAFGGDAATERQPQSPTEPEAASVPPAATKPSESAPVEPAPIEQAEAAHHAAANARVAEPRIVESKDAEPQMVEQQIAEPRVTQPQTIERRVTQPQIVEQKVTQPQVDEPRISESRAAESRVADSRAAEPRIAESRAADSRLADSSAAESRIVPPRAAETLPPPPTLEPAANLSRPPRCDEEPSPAGQPTDVLKGESPEGVLIAHRGPILSVETVGPRTISVGREASYEVGITNSGEVPAEGLIVYIALPTWTDVVGAGASSGTAEMAGANQPQGTIQWKLGRMNAKARERLTLKIVPRQSRSFDLAVHWNYKPPASQAAIEVQEPRLLLQLDGPREVLYGKKQLYHLKVVNTGTGSAENVVLTLLPLGTGANVPATYKAGLLRSKQEKTLDVELTARQIGNLTIQVDARAEGGAKAELSEKVMVRRACLKVAVEGPKVQFVGTSATYTVTIRNPGNAPAHNVNLSVNLPAGARYLSGIEGAHQDPTGGRIDWTIDHLGPDVEQSFVLKCTMGLAGEGQIHLDATAADDLSAAAEVAVQIQSVASLSMEVRDPSGPTPVGDEANYEIHVRNRGTREAQGVEVFAYFSRGIEPTGADGSPNRLGPGQVVFQAIPSLAPGAEAVLRVRAKADVAGNHIFRAEAHCKPLGARLIREATNLYYGDAPAVEQAARTAAPSDRPQAK